MGVLARTSSALTIAVAFGLLMASCGGDDHRGNVMAPTPTTAPDQVAVGTVGATTPNDLAVSQAREPENGPAPAEVDVCHVDGQGRFHLITVSPRAEAAHRAHGDGLIGEAVPGQPGQVFGGDCQPGAIAVDIEKATEGADADAPGDGPFLLAGAAVHWTYVVANTGQVPLDDITVTDDRGVVVTCPGTLLGPGESMTCAGAGTVEAGAYANIGTASANSIAAQNFATASDSDPSHYFGAVPGIAIEKTTNGEDADTPPGPSLPPGSLVSWTYRVTNTGNVALTQVTVADDRGVAVTCPSDAVAPGADMICSGDGVAAPGQYANVGTATGTPPVGPSVTASDPSHYLGVPEHPSIEIVKATNGEDANELPGPLIAVGSPVTWTYVVTNVGNVPLADVGVTDSRGELVSCPTSRLAVGEAMTCTAQGVAGPGVYTNVGEVTARSPDATIVSASDRSHYTGLAEQPAIDIEKATEGEDADTGLGPILAVGSPVTWTYEVRNTGDAMLTDIAVTDDQGVDVRCPGTTLPPGEAMTCVGSDTVRPGHYQNIGTVVGLDPNGQAVSDSDPSRYFSPTPAIDLEKATNGVDSDTPPGQTLEVGTPVTWSYVVTNLGDFGLTDIVVTDDQLGVIACPNDNLGAGASMTCSETGTVVEGPYRNVGTVSAQSPDGRSVSASDPSHYNGRVSMAAIQIEKATNGVDADSAPGPTIVVGQEVQWTYAVTNTGNVAVTDITVEDDRGVLVGCPGSEGSSTPGRIDRLEVGQTVLCAAYGVAALGPYVNRGTATGMGPDDLPVSDVDDSHYVGRAQAENPEIDIEKQTQGVDADEPPGPAVTAGSPVTWTYIVTNTGDVPLNDIVVTDDRGVDVTCPKSTLNPGDQMSCTGTGTAVEGQYRNVGSVEARDPNGRPVTDSDPSHYFGQP